MLQLWPDPIRIVITPESVAIKLDKKTLEVIELEAPHNDKPAWDNALLAVEQYTGAIKAKQVKFVIANRFVRYAILPSHSDVFSQNDWQALAVNHLRKIYGSIVDDWLVTVTLQAYDKPAIVSAVDRALLARIDSVANQFNWEIDAVEPALMSVVNHFRKKLKADTTLMMIESNRVLFTEINSNCITHFSISSPVSGNEQLESNKLLQRYTALSSDVNVSDVNIFSDIELAPYPVGGILTISSLTQGFNHKSMSALLAELR